MCWSLFRQRRTGEWSEANDAMGRSAEMFEQVLDTLTTGEAGILVRPSADQDAEQAKAEIQRALDGVPASTARWDVTLDETEHPHPWVIVRESGLPPLANAARVVGEALALGGLGPRVLAAVYPFRWKERRIYWIYQPRIKAFTPFAPAAGPEREERDHPLELRMEQAVRRELPTSRDIKEWYPIWGMPF